MALAVAEDDQWWALVELLGSPPWATDRELARRRRPPPVAHDHIDGYLGAWLARLAPRTRWRPCRPPGVPAEVVDRPAGRGPQPPAAPPGAVRGRAPPGHRRPRDPHACPSGSRASSGGCGSPRPPSANTTRSCWPRSASMPAELAALTADGRRRRPSEGPLSDRRAAQTAGEQRGVGAQLPAGHGLPEADEPLAVAPLEAVEDGGLELLRHRRPRAPSRRCGSAARRRPPAGGRPGCCRRGRRRRGGRAPRGRRRPWPRPPWPPRRRRSPRRRTRRPGRPGRHRAPSSGRDGRGRRTGRPTPSRTGGGCAGRPRRRAGPCAARGGEGSRAARASRPRRRCRRGRCGSRPRAGTPPR